MIYDYRGEISEEKGDSALLLIRFRNLYGRKMNMTRKVQGSRTNCHSVFFWMLFGEERVARRLLKQIVARTNSCFYIPVRRTIIQDREGKGYC